MFSKKTLKLYYFILLLVLLLVIIINIIHIDTITSEEYFSDHYALGYTKFNIKGTVIDKYIDKKQHSNPTIVVNDTSNNNYMFFFQTDDTCFFNFIEIGDTIISEQFSFKATVIKKDSLKKTFNFSKNLVVE